MSPRHGRPLTNQNYGPTETEDRGTTIRRSTRKKTRPKYDEEEVLDVVDEILCDTFTESGLVVENSTRNPKRCKQKTKKDATKNISSGIEGPQQQRKRAIHGQQGNIVEMPDEFEYLEISINDPHDSQSTNHITSSTSGRESLSPKSTLDKKNPNHSKTLQIAARHTHLICLLVAYGRKSLALRTPILRAHLLSLVPSHLLRQFTKEILDDGRTLLNALSMLANWWKNNMSRQNQKYDGQVLGTFTWLSKRIPHVWLREVADNKHGTDEDLVAIFVAILRALGLKTRYVVSLQPVLVKPANVDSSIEDKVPKFWCEVWQHLERRWVSVDCLRAIVNDRLSMEPPSLLTKIGRQHLFVIAFDSRGRPFDVTRRYCSRYYGWTAKLRRSDECCLFLDPIDPEEACELAALVDGEPIPTTLAGFQGNGRYMLERQLHKYEVFFPPDSGIVGEFRGENVRLRSVVQKVKSKEAWYTQFGRVIKDGEVPAKVVKLPKKPERKLKTRREWEKEIDNAIVPKPKEYFDQPLWGEWQTIPHQPAVAENGQVPRNKFGNVDLYLQSMLPIGCVWIDEDLAWRAAKDLEIDYAAACIKFTFSGRFAVPTLRGIVVCQEYEGAVLRRLGEIKEELIDAKDNKAEEEAKQKVRLERKRKKIREKIILEHGLDPDLEEPYKNKETTIISALETKAKSKDGDFEDLF